MLNKMFLSALMIAVFTTLTACLVSKLMWGDVFIANPLHVAGVAVLFFSAAGYCVVAINQRLGLVYVFGSAIVSFGIGIFLVFVVRNCHMFGESLLRNFN